MRRFALPPMAGLVLLTAAMTVPAQLPVADNPPSAAPSGGLNNLIGSTPQDINATYAVTPDAGPWMICAASYIGDSAPELAYLLCTYLRQQRQAAYVYNRGGEERRKMQEELDQRQKMYPGLPRRRVLA
ncbi:MAG: hypothetical protein ACRELF_25840, partial [Gemmataceae bacterium]